MKAIHLKSSPAGGGQPGHSDTVQLRWLVSSSLGYVSVFGLVIVMVTAVLSPLNVSACPNAPLDLPPRPPTPTPVSIIPTPVPGQPPEAQPAGAWIEVRLTCEPTCAGLLWGEIWAVVQWQDASGRWHDVEGWHGTMDMVRDRQATQTWWVAQKDFGAGPFRWKVCKGGCDKPFGTSAPFHLPSTPNQTLLVEMTVRVLSSGGLPIPVLTAVPSGSAHRPGCGSASWAK